MKKLFTLFCFLLVSGLFAQSNYELGYYVTTSGEMVNGEIGAISIGNFPDKFYFKNGKKVEEISVDAVNKIKYGTHVFEKRNFQYDPSLRINIDEMSSKATIDLVDHTTFVELLINGNINYINM